MRSNTNLNQTSFSTVLKTFQNIMCETVSFLTENSANIEDLKANGTEVKSLIEKRNSIHKHLKSVHDEHYIVSSKVIILGEREEIRCVDNVDVSVLIKDTAQYFPILELLKLILQNDNLRGLIENESTEGNFWNYKLYTDSQEFKSHSLFRQYPKALRILLYSDDIELVNPIGAKTGIHKLTMFYFKILNFPPYFNAKVENVFLLAIAYTYDVKRYGYKKVLESFMIDLNLLEDGITLKLNGEDYFIIGTLVKYTGDALAAAEIMEMLSPSSVRFCRSCVITRNDLIIRSIYNFDKRNIETHNNQLELLRQGLNIPKDFGIKSVNSILNDSKYFHTTNNLVFDIMHDLLEGLLPMEIKLVLQYYVIEKKYFTVEFLNESINLFKYGQTERKNKPGSNFTIPMLQGKNQKIKQKAVQTWLLLRVLPFLILHKIPTEDNNHMLLLNLLLKIVEIVFSFDVSEQMVCDLDETIKSHHGQFKHLFPNINYINKHHYVTHYPESIRKNGPLVLYSCLSFEAKHQDIKKFISRGCNFINMPKSIANHFAVEQSMLIFHQKYQLPDEEIISSSDCLLENFVYKELLLLKHPLVKNAIRIFVMKINSMRFMKNVVITLTNENALYPYFYTVKDMCKADNTIYLYMQALKTLLFDSDLNAFKIEETNEMILFNINNIENFKPTSLWGIGGTKYISIKEYHF